MKKAEGTAMNNIFYEGRRVQLSDMLLAREQRSDRQRHLLENSPDCSLLSATMNIPGPVKKNKLLKACFDQMLVAVQDSITDDVPEAYRYIEENTGMEYYLLTHLSAKKLKERMVLLEENLPLGRIFDLDVLYCNRGKLASVSRTDIDFPKRRCFICNREAKDCARSRRHSVEEMQRQISELVLAQVPDRESRLKFL